MYKINEIVELIDQARTGAVPASGDVVAADELIGFSFGLYFDNNGQLGDPGPVNEAIADYVLSDEILRTKNMTLQEELAVAIEAREPKFADQIETLKTIKEPGRAFNSHELLVTAKPSLLARNVGSLAVLAFRHHQPRVAAQVRKSGFEAIIPDMSEVGDFDPHSPQEWTRNSDVWIKRERIAIAMFAVLGRI